MEDWIFEELEKNIKSTCRISRTIGCIDGFIIGFFMGVTLSNLAYIHFSMEEENPLEKLTLFASTLAITYVTCQSILWLLRKRKNGKDSSL